jgi:hypothetical protein
MIHVVLMIPNRLYEFEYTLRQRSYAQKTERRGFLNGPYILTAEQWLLAMVSQIHHG